MEPSTSRPFGLFLLFGSSIVMITMIATITTKIQPIRSRKGISGMVNLMSVESGIDSKAPVSAAAEVVRFQKKPSIKIANTPGEIKPVYSWMYWKP